MTAIVLKVPYAVKQRLLRNLRRCRRTDLRQRYLVVINVLNGRSACATAAVLQIHNTTVYRDLDQLYQLVRATPQDYGWRRPSWTRELLVETMVRLTAVRIHVATMSRALARIKARRGRPRPTVGCPWSKAAKTRRLQRIGQMLATLPRREQAFYQDEVDIHLNPKLGLDWMAAGQQKQVGLVGLAPQSVSGGDTAACDLG